MSHIMRKPAFCICENKAADQLCGHRTADQRLWFHYTDRTIPLFPKSEFSSLQLSSVAAQPGLCRTWSETPKTGFLTSFLISLCLFLIHENCVCSGSRCTCGEYCTNKRFQKVSAIMITCLCNMSLVVRKAVFGVSDQVRHKPGCRPKEDG